MIKIERFTSDLSGLVMSRLYKLHCLIICFVSTYWCRLKMRIWGIKYGKRCSFRGNMIFYRSVGSVISLGCNCTFNSNSRYNFRGINHKSVLQAVNGGKIIIGNHFGASGISIVSNISVIIGDNVRCGTNVMIGDRNGHERIYPDWQPKPVTIGNNVWIGMNSIVMRGVTIGNNSIIGAGSIVTKDIPSNVIAAGIPCSVIRER